MHSNLGSAGRAAAVAFVLGLLSLAPRTTEAEEIADYERSGEYDEDGQRFGDLVVSGKLTPDAKAPGGWVLVRTLENKGDAPVECALEERVQSTLTMHGSRVDPPPTTAQLQTLRLTLKPHEKRKVGVLLPSGLAVDIGKAVKQQASVEAAIARELTADSPRGDVFQKTWRTYHVDYLTPLPPGATAAKPPSDAVMPAAMPMAIGSGRAASLL